MKNDFSKVFFTEETRATPDDWSNISDGKYEWLRVGSKATIVEAVSGSYKVGIIGGILVVL